jgi:hypothetical protein
MKAKKIRIEVEEKLVGGSRIVVQREEQTIVHPAMLGLTPDAATSCC